jgi:2-haloacid dehalogenase
MKFSDYKVLSFDCYGTLVDWEKGIIDTIRGFAATQNLRIEDDEILRLYSVFEAREEQSEYKEYKQVLRNVMKSFAAHLEISNPSAAELDSLATSIQSWEPFWDTRESLRKFKAKYKLAIISNVDDDIFEATAKKLGVEFDYVITAQQARCYKPRLEIFEYAIEKFGVATSDILHIGQSLYHDIQPAAKLGIATVWVNRSKGKRETGATPEVEATPDIVVPDLATLVEIMYSVDGVN